MRNLVLLLTSGHTVRIALRDDDKLAPTRAGVLDFLETLSAVHGFASAEVVFVYIESTAVDMTGGDFDRITVEGPGTVVQYG